MSIPQSELDAFKYDMSAPSGQLYKGESTAQKPVPKPAQKVLVKNHRILGPIWRELMSDLNKLNSHGAEEDEGRAFGPASHPQVQAAPPSNSEMSQRELSRKKKVIPDSGHHGATPAGKETYAIGKPHTTTPTVPATAPPHSSYFTQPSHQPTMQTEPAKMAGGDDELRKRKAAADLIKQAQRRPFSSPDDI